MPVLIRVNQLTRILSFTFHAQEPSNGALCSVTGNDIVRINCILFLRAAIFNRRDDIVTKLAKSISHAQSQIEPHTSCNFTKE